MILCTALIGKGWHVSDMPRGCVANAAAQHDSHGHVAANACLFMAVCRLLLTLATNGVAHDRVCTYGEERRGERRLS